MIQWFMVQIGLEIIIPGMKSIVFNAKDGNNVAIGISSITNGVPFMTTSHSNTSRCTTLKRRKPL
jgi:hypothetical protein